MKTCNFTRTSASHFLNAQVWVVKVGLRLTGISYDIFNRDMPSVSERLALCETGPPVWGEASPVNRAFCILFLMPFFCTLQKSHSVWRLFIPIPHNRDDGEGTGVTNDVRLSCDKGFLDHIQIQPARQPPNPHGHPGRDLYPLIFSLSQADGFESNSSWLLGLATKAAYKYARLNNRGSLKHTHIAANVALKTNQPVNKETI